MAATETRDLILDTAETLFADRGFHGVSIREIADAAGVRQSLVHYHFTDKQTLYGAVYARRALPIHAERSARLQALCAEQDTPALRALVDALLAPSVRASRKRKGSIYARMIAQLTNDPQPHALRISRSYNDPIAREMVAALGKALPGTDSATLTWAYLFTIGAMTMATASTGRAKRLDPACDPKDVEGVLDLLGTFVEGGVRALCERQRPTRRTARSKRIDAATART
jgi:AcrR family transcriptional regulator